MHRKVTKIRFVLDFEDDDSVQFVYSTQDRVDALLADDQSKLGEFLRTMRDAPMTRKKETH